MPAGLSGGVIGRTCIKLHVLITRTADTVLTELQADMLPAGKGMSPPAHTRNGKE